MNKIVLTLPTTPEALARENKQLKARLLLLKKVVSILSAFKAHLVSL